VRIHAETCGTSATASADSLAYASLTTAIRAYVAAGGDPTRLAAWLVSQIRLSHHRVAQALFQSSGRYVGVSPDRRSFTEIG
jgi:hypothetical protein